LDWTFLTAKHLGEGEAEKWLLTIVDEQGRLLAAWFTRGTALDSKAITRAAEDKRVQTDHYRSR
jgi:hypothetical protein